MDNASGLADRSSDSAIVLTVAHKSNLTCIYVFHTIYPSRSKWQMIISQTNIFKIFAGSLQTTSFIKILSSYCNRYIYEYIPYKDLWINRLYFKISNFRNTSTLVNSLMNITIVLKSIFIIDTFPEYNSHLLDVNMLECMVFLSYIRLKIHVPFHLLDQ